MLKLIERIGDAKLAVRFVRDVFPKDYDGSEGQALLSVCERFGWERAAPWVRSFVDQQDPKDHFTRLTSIASICEALCCGPPELTEERRAACESLADPLERLIARFDEQPISEWAPESDARAGVVAIVVHVYAVTGATAHLGRFVSHVLEDRRRYDLHAVLIPDTKALHQSLKSIPATEAAVAQLLEHCFEQLRAATAKPIEPPKDWTREADLDCDCEHCRALGQFLRDPAARVGRFPLRKDRRQHLHQQIDRHGCDCTHETERKGSPQTLVCTKNQGSYERRLKQYDVDQKLLAELEVLAAGKSPAATKKPAKRRMSKT